ncbi:MAG TPA: response regulator [Longimicrobiales bacterium]|nr:response regulator [Longimicrobiales bacterium]
MNGESAVLLIAEDEPLASMALRAQAEALGHTVAAIARDGIEAAALVLCVPADLAIFDMKMPRLTGIEAAATTFPDALTPVLLLTGFGAADLPDPLPEPPVFALVTKPIGLQELYAGIERARARFRDWARDHDRLDDIRQVRDRQAEIARALDRLDRISGPAATRFLNRARDERLAPVELARRILHDVTRA